VFSVFSSEKKKMRRDAENWLRLAEKVYHYRRDLLKEKELQELIGARAHLSETLRRNQDASEIRLASERMEDVLRRTGGPYYRKFAWTDNVEVLLVAAILAIGIRTYFVQPFKIPTNSMWPTYYGMTHEVFSSAEEEPGAASKLARGLVYGARRYVAYAPVSGEVSIALAREQGGLARHPVPMRRFLVIPGQAYEYEIYVGNTPVMLRVPLEFQMEPVFHDAFFPDAPSYGAAMTDRVQRGAYREGPGGRILVPTGLRVEEGEQVLNFDILTGDQLFVDRMSYHFVAPKVGDGIVFRTRNIPALRRPDGAPDDKYYIKRLVGVSSDVLSIESPVLLRNGEPIDGRRVFERIHARDGRYTGYVPDGMLGAGRSVTIPPNQFFAMGDNSPNSLDSRAFGSVSEQEVVGRSLFIYYPFTRRWGPAQ